MLKLFAILAIAAVASANVVPNTCEVNKCSDSSMKLVFLGKHDRPSDQPTDEQTDRPANRWTWVYMEIVNANIANLKKYIGVLK